MDPYNPMDIIKYLDETTSQEEKDFLNSPEAQKEFEHFKTIVDQMKNTKENFNEHTI